MSYYIGDPGSKILEYWQQNQASQSALRQWMRNNGLADEISLTVFSRLERFEGKRRQFLQFLAATKRKTRSPGKAVKAPAAAKNAGTAA